VKANNKWRMMTSNEFAAVEATTPLVPWLDPDTAALLRRMVALLAVRRSDLRAVILFGSVARHDERPLTDAHPSDVDLQVLFETEPMQQTISGEQHAAISWALLDALDTYPETPREVQTVAMLSNLAGRDSTFLENVSSDGIVLWQRGPLPSVFASLAEQLGPSVEIDSR